MWVSGEGVARTGEMTSLHTLCGDMWTSLQRCVVMKVVCAREQGTGRRVKGSGSSELPVLAAAAANSSPCMQRKSLSSSGKQPGAGWSAMAESTQAEVCG